MTKTIVMDTASMNMNYTIDFNTSPISVTDTVQETASLPAENDVSFLNQSMQHESDSANEDPMCPKYS